jgi:hypothetical protein
MKNEILRDVLAGCAGVLVVAAAIGLPKGPAPAAPSVQVPVPVQHTELLPFYSGLRSSVHPGPLGKPVPRPTP